MKLLKIKLKLILIISIIIKHKKKFTIIYNNKLGMSIGPSGVIVDNEGKTVSESKLNNLQTSGSFSKEFNQSFQQSRDDAMNSLILKKLNPQQQQMFGQILDLNKQIEQKRIELAEKHGANANLPFLMNPILPNVGDQFAR